MEPSKREIASLFVRYQRSGRRLADLLLLREGGLRAVIPLYLRRCQDQPVLVSVLALAVVPVAIAGAAAAVRSRTTPPIGTQLAELVASNTIA
jgi:hypothetical protein